MFPAPTTLRWWGPASLAWRRRGSSSSDTPPSVLSCWRRRKSCVSVLLRACRRGLLLLRTGRCVCVCVCTVAKDRLFVCSVAKGRSLCVAKEQPLGVVLEGLVTACCLSVCRLTVCPPVCLHLPVYHLTVCPPVCPPVCLHRPHHRQPSTRAATTAA